MGISEEIKKHEQAVSDLEKEREHKRHELERAKRDSEARSRDIRHLEEEIK